MMIISPIKPLLCYIFLIFPFMYLFYWNYLLSWVIFSIPSYVMCISIIIFLSIHIPRQYFIERILFLVNIFLFYTHPHIYWTYPRDYTNVSNYYTIIIIFIVSFHPLYKQVVWKLRYMHTHYRSIYL